MMLIKAETLRKNFEVWAHFYTVRVDEKEYLMRSEAKIIRKGKETSNADAVIVMANPGSCTAIDQNAKFVSLDEKKNFVKANPDPTQYQLMNLMERMNWDSLKIINLSDVCTGNYKEFKEYLKEFKANKFNEHTIFCERRKEELDCHIKGANLIFAWGTNSAIKEIAKDVVDRQLVHKGLEHSQGIYYRHPKPATLQSRIRLLDCLEVQLKEA